MTQRSCAWLAVLGVVLSPLQRRVVADDLLPDNDVIMRAIVSELNRSMELRMEDLEKPYFIQFSVDDSIVYRLAAAYGAITTSQRDRSRDFYSRVRVGSYELDNTNFSGGGEGEHAPLPLTDDEIAIRQFIWRAVDRDYKSEVETLTKKRAYMKDKNIEDRPNDFSRATPTQHIDAGAELHFDKTTWERNLKLLSARFKRYNRVQDSSVQLFVGAGNAFVVNSEGTRVRTGDQGVLLAITAEAQADDGMKISNGRSYSGDTTRDLPAIDKLLSDIDALVATLTEALAAPILDEYTGPVLFDGQAADQVFRQMLADGVAGKVDPVGTQRRRFEGAENLEKKLGRRILPKSFQIYDDPTVRKVGDTLLLGHYQYDDEGVKAQHVDIVVDGVLKGMAMSRVPTKKLSGSNGHGRRGMGAGSPSAAIACLFVKDNEGLPDDKLKAELIDAAKDEGLDYGLRVTLLRSAGVGSSQSDIFAFFMRLQQGGNSGLSDPVLIYKVYVDDGREELVRGCEFGPVEIRNLREIVAAGTKQTVHNYIDIGFGGASPPSSIIAPAVLFRELDVSKIEQEYDKLPILKSPAARDAT